MQSKAHLPIRFSDEIVGRWLGEVVERTKHGESIGTHIFKVDPVSDILLGHEGHADLVLPSR